MSHSGSDKNDKFKNPNFAGVTSPIPIRTTTSSASQLRHPEDHHSFHLDDESRSFTPSTWDSVQKHVTARRPSYNTIVNYREKFYNLDYPKDGNTLAKLQLDPKSRFYSRSRPRTLNLASLMPYRIESPEEQAKFLSHIVSHLYIAIKSLDIQGSLSISAKDLAALKESISDVDIALETNLFEINTAETHEDEPMTDDLDTSDEEMVEDDDDDDDKEEDDDEGEEGEGEDDENDKDATIQHKRSPKSAAVVTVRTWTHELLIWLKMKYDMPVTLKIRLARVYYALCLCRGQHIGIKTYVRVFEILTKDQKLLYAQGLRLNWEDLYKEFQLLFPSPDPSLGPFEKKDQRQLGKLATKASYFFDPKSLPIIFEKLGSNFAVSTSALTISSFALLPMNFTTGGVDDEYDIRHYLSPLFYMWLKINKSKGLDEHITGRLGVIVMSTLFRMHDDENVREVVKLGKFGILSQSQMELLFNEMINSFGIRNEKYASKKSKYFHGFASAIVFSMAGDKALEEGGIIYLLKTLVNAIESYIHPSNSGEWTRPISRALLALIYQFHKRYNLEAQTDGDLYNIPSQVKLSSTVVKAFVKIMLPVVKTGIQSKRDEASSEYVTALQLLAHLDPNYVLDNTLLDIYESLEGVISTHRVINALRMVDSMARSIVSTPIFRVHLTRILSLLLPGIDSNDLEKTLQTLEVVSAISNYAPIYDLSGEYGDTSLAMEFTQNHIEYLKRKIYDGDVEPFAVDKQTEIDALVSSTSAFKEIFKSLAQKLPPLLENLPDPHKSYGPEQDLAISLPKFFVVIFESMSDDIFRVFRKEWFEFVFNNVHHTSTSVVADVSGVVVRRDPKCFKQNARILMDKIHEEIDENGAGSSRTGEEVVPRDQALSWNLTILSDCAAVAGSQLVGMHKELMDFSTYLMQNVKGPCIFPAAFLVNQVLQSVTRIRINESRLISPKYEKEHGVDETCWGGFWNSDDRFVDTSFDWFVPTEKEVNFAYEFFNDHATICTKNVITLMKSYEQEQSKNSIALLDDLRKNIVYFGYSLSGISFLLDPSFEEDIPKLDHEAESIQQRLALLKQIRNLKDVSTQEDYLYDDKVSENMQQILNDLRNEDPIDYIADFDKMNEMITEHEAKEDEVEAEAEADEDSHKFTTPEQKNVLHRHFRAPERPDSTAPDSVSGRETPRIEGIQMSSMNPAITFREKSLYTSNYFFGDNSRHKEHRDLYLKIHKTRHLIGRSLHFIHKFLVSNFPDNTRIFRNLLLATNTWISDVGRERLLKPNIPQIDYGYVQYLQTINRVRKPFTRIAIGARLESYHQSRVALHATSRSETNLDRVLLEDVIKLSSSTYVTIASIAQKVLVDSSRRISGSYSHIIKSTFRNLKKALDADDHRQIESILKVFLLRRLKGKLQNDYLNVQKYLALLYRCLKVDDPKVYKLAQSLYGAVGRGITTPSSVCLIDHEAIDQIRPPDQYIDLEIKAVQLAKEKKRHVYFDKLEKLQDKVLELKDNVTHWKITMSNSELLSNLQAHLDIPTRGNVLESFSNEASSEHPIISRHALLGITRILNKLHVLEQYEYKFDNLYDTNFVPRGWKVVDTNPVNGESFTSKWMSELRNTTHPEYFLDTKPYSGWLFWGESITVITPELGQNLAVNEEDEAALRRLGHSLDKEWITKIVKMWASEAENSNAFQVADVMFLVVLVLSISNGYTPKLTYSDLLSTVDEIYVAGEKGANIVVCEVLSGILLASKCTAPQYWEERDEFVIKYLKQVFEHDISPGTSAAWGVFCLYVSAHTDSRRFHKVIEEIANFKLDPNSDSAFKDSTRISYIKSVISSTSWKLGDPDKFLDLCLDNMNHKYNLVRREIGSLMAVVSLRYYVESIKDCKAFVQGCNRHDDLLLYKKKGKLFDEVPRLFEQTEKWRTEVVHLDPQEILVSNYINSATTILTWLRQELGTNLSILLQDLVHTHIVPFLLELINLKEVCQLGNIDPISVLKKASQITFTENHLEDIVVMLEDYSQKDLNIVQSIVIGEFTETIFFKNLFKLTKSQRERIVNVTNSLLYHKHVEVREAEAETLAGLVHMLPLNEVDDIVRKFSQSYSQQLDQTRAKYNRNFKNITFGDHIALHGATLGLGALINAFPFASPPPKWMPSLLSTLANKSTGIPGIVGKTAKETLGRFRKDRQDSWHVDSKVFQDDQIQDLEGVLWRSYFI
ncbi:BLM3 [Candida theae]|uniref:BLM3 n=1 Tax=Candida theae TaxID=1198502 RepID=A0AAD5BD73_9ASCO|nr:BLM3 [Candida theae]KAI5953786.1 BLM3 [Candida theae]